MAKASGLFSVSINPEGFTGSGSGDEARKNHAVATGLAWADGIEQSGDDDRQATFAREGQSHELVHQLRTGIAPAQVRGRTNEQIVVFGKRFLLALAIDLR